MLNKNPPHLLIFQFFPNPMDLIRTPINNFLRKCTFFTNTSFHFLSLLVLLTPNFHGKIAYCCKCFSFMFCDNLFLFFPSLSNHSKPFLKFQPPVYFDPPFIKFWNIFQPLSLLVPPFIWYLIVCYVFTGVIYDYCKLGPFF